ncbi:MAG: metalloregulator ArsR/SmtB family transcription factor [Desulfosalsimonadaceae bacterium]
MVEIRQNDIETDDITCGIRIIHEDTVNRVKGHLPDRTISVELASFFKLFADPTRISILWALSKAEMCVCDLCALLGMKQSAVSQQLKILRQSRIVKNRRDGKVIYYSLDDDHIEGVLKLGMNHILERKP